MRLIQSAWQGSADTCVGVRWPCGRKETQLFGIGRASHEESRFAQDTVDDLRRKIAERVGFASEAISLHLDGRPLLPTESTRVATELGASVGGVSSSVMGAIAIGGVSSSIMDAIKIGGVSS